MGGDDLVGCVELKVRKHEEIHPFQVRVTAIIYATWTETKFIVETHREPDQIDIVEETCWGPGVTEVIEDTY